MLELTPEQEVQRNYDAAMDSVNLLTSWTTKRHD